MARKLLNKRGFTFIELLITVTILGFLMMAILPTVTFVREKAKFARAKKELDSIHASLQMYAIDHNTYPADANRSVPPGLEPYLAGGDWPDGVWPGSVFDWDNWEDPDNPGERIYQISLRFCPIGEPENCNFPNLDWAENFDINSSVYMCLGGACRAHIARPIDHPGYCINCYD